MLIRIKENGRTLLFGPLSLIKAVAAHSFLSRYDKLSFDSELKKRPARGAGLVTFYLFSAVNQF